MDKALDAGAGPGGSAISMCSDFAQVEAFDYNQTFVDFMDEKCAADKITNLKSYQGDAHNMEGDNYNLILGCNLIDRLSHPIKWLESAKKMIKAKNGLVINSDPYTWLEQFADVENWIGAVTKDGKPYHTTEALKDIMGPELVLYEETKIPFVIPNENGSYDYTYSIATVWGAPRD